MRYAGIILGGSGVFTGRPGGTMLRLWRPNNIHTIYIPFITVHASKATRFILQPANNMRREQ